MQHSPTFAAQVAMKFLSILYFILILLGSISCNNNTDNAKKPNKGKPFPYRPLTATESDGYIKAIEHMYDSLFGKSGFNGSILIAKNGKILFEKYQGYHNLSTKDTIAANTPFHLASVTKPFTAMAVLALYEQGKLELEDSLQRFFPAFPYQGVTVSQLLSHRSGLPNYVYFMSKDTAWNQHEKASNTDMLNYMIAKHPAPYAKPGKNFSYCNTNYALLALIVEKVTGLSFPTYMKDSVFTPLGMKDTYVFGVADTARYIPSYLNNGRAFDLAAIDCIYGDKNMYSTVRDIWQWEKAMYNNELISEATYQKAITPYSNERPSVHNYGLGWRLMILPDRKMVYHNGWWHGNNTVFTRAINDTATIIILGNKYNRGIYRGFGFSKIFHGHSPEADPED
jgi:CubicO group peptidase (beta-lactamase class C family)